MNKILDVLRWWRRRFYRWYFGLYNTDKKFLATNGLGKVSKDISADAYSYIGPNCLIYPKVSIGKYSLLANDVMIVGGDHNYRVAGIPMAFAGRDELKSTTIGMDVWIGARSTIMCGVNIGDGAIIAAGSVVTKDVEPYSIYAGVPAKKIKDRFSENDKSYHIKSLDGLSLNAKNLEQRLARGSKH